MAKIKQAKNPNSAPKWWLALIPVGALGAVAAFMVFNAPMEDVVVMNQTVYANTQLSSDMISVAKMHKEDLPPNYITSNDAGNVVGLYTNVGAVQGSVLTLENLATQDTKKAANIPNGQTLLSISISAIPQGVVPGDRVNILVGMTSESGRMVMTYQNIQVTNTNKDSNGNVTAVEVQVTPDQAQKIEFAQLNGELAIALLPPDYTSTNLEPTRDADAQNFNADSGPVNGDQSVLDNSDEQENGLDSLFD